MDVNCVVLVFRLHDGVDPLKKVTVYFTIDLQLLFSCLKIVSMILNTFVTFFDIWIVVIRLRIQTYVTGWGGDPADSLPAGAGVGRLRKFVDTWVWKCTDPVPEGNLEYNKVVAKGTRKIHTSIRSKLVMAKKAKSTYRMETYGFIYKIALRLVLLLLIYYYYLLKC